MAHALERKIADREARLASLSDEIARLRMEQARLEAEVGAYRDALTYIVPDAQPLRQSSRRSSEKPSDSASPRGISKAWREILMAAFGEDGSLSANLDDILSAAKCSDHNISRNNARSQMGNYVSRGWVAREGHGVFRLTAEGADAIGLEHFAAAAAKENAPPEGGADTGGVSPPSVGRQASFDVGGIGSSATADPSSTVTGEGG